jgi:predicted AAA+ superfamily ATPase
VCRQSSSATRGTDRALSHLSTGLVRRIAQVDEGALFENAVHWNLQQKGTVQYYQRQSGVEIDFFLNKHHAYEVKLHPGKEDIYKLHISDQTIRWLLCG